MKILNREEFLKQNNGILYSLYAPDELYGLFVKVDTFDFDWVLLDLVDTRESKTPSKDDLWKISDESLKTGTSIDISYDSTVRDGMYDDKQLFAVYEKDDLNKLTDFLNQINIAYPEINIDKK